MTGNMDKAVALLPCPFCGDAMQPRDALWPSEGDVDGIIHAKPTDCPMPEFTVGTADSGVSVAAAWNTRAIPHLGAQREEIARAIYENELEDCERFEPWDDTFEIDKKQYYRQADAILSLPTVQGQAWRAPEGWKLVPVEPTEEIAESVGYDQDQLDSYRHMVANAPSPPAEGE